MVGPTIATGSAREGPMELDELRRVREAERSTDSLQHLDDDFYVEVGTYLDELRDRRDDLAAESSDPFTDSDVRQVTDELTTATRIVESLYERRVGKIVKLASFAAADMHAETEGLTSEEQELFEAIVDDIRANRETVLDILDEDSSDHAAGTVTDDATLSRGDSSESRSARGGTPSSEDHDEPEREVGPDEHRAATDSSVSDTEQRSEPEPEPDPEPDASGPSAQGGESGRLERTTVRIREDIGEIVGVDEHAYELAADDIVSLPTDNARPLIERGVADDLE